MPGIQNLTKIVCTLGPSSESPEIIGKLIESGVDFFRLNTKHNSLDWHLNLISIAKKVADSQRVSVGIMVDLQGPEIGLRRLAQRKKADSVVSLDASSQNVSEAPTLSQHDLDILKSLPKDIVDFIALSFVRSKEDVVFLREELIRLNLKSRIVAKIENQSGLDNIDEILQVADAIMIARGDLGIETPPERIPYYQKLIINKCRNEAKPVIVATEMLLSMVDRDTPTRAEIADIANAVYDHADALMLSEETAVGKHPVEAVEIMSKTIAFNEMQDSLGIDFMPDSLDQTHAVVKSALSMLQPFSGVNISKLVVGTQTGYSARVFSSYRPKVQILALSDKEDTIGTLPLNFGVYPVLADLEADYFMDSDKVIAHLKDLSLLRTGETILLIHGQRTNDPGNTNSLSVITVH